MPQKYETVALFLLNILKHKLASRMNMPVPNKPIVNLQNKLRTFVSTSGKRLRMTAGFLPFGA